MSYPVLSLLYSRKSWRSQISSVLPSYRSLKICSFMNSFSLMLSINSSASFSSSKLSCWAWLLFFLWVLAPPASIIKESSSLPSSHDASTSAVLILIFLSTGSPPSIGYFIIFAGDFSKGPRVNEKMLRLFLYWYSSQFSIISSSAIQTL